jgi:PAS domain S-box-containing protein
VGDGVAGPEDVAGEADRDRQHAPDPVGGHRRGQPGPARVGPQVGRSDHLVAGEGVDAGPLVEVALGPLKGLLGLAGGGDPAEGAGLVGQHQPGAVGPNQQRRRVRDLVQGGRQVVEARRDRRRLRGRHDRHRGPGAQVGVRRWPQQPAQLLDRPPGVAADGHRDGHRDRVAAPGLDGGPPVAGLPTGQAGEAVPEPHPVVGGDKDTSGLPDTNRYFERNGQGYVFSKDLRRSVIFGRHDLIQDAPISRIDLLVCRNTLMYLNSETQSHVLARFSFALREGGYLLLGKAEMLLAHSNLFTSVDFKWRVFQKVPGATLRERLMVLTDAGRPVANNPSPREDRVRNAAMEASPEAQIVVDAGGYLAIANSRARELFSLKPDDIGRPFQDLELSYRPLELRSKIQQVYVERHASPVVEVEWPTADGETANLEIQITPLVDEHQVLLGASVSFADVTRSRRYKAELEHANQGLEDAYAELQSTNEELETTNEELQSTVKELETTNEELQSTNEELRPSTTSWASGRPS